MLSEVEKLLEPLRIALEQKSRDRINALRATLDLEADKLEEAASNQNTRAVQDLMPDGESIPIIGSEQSNAPLQFAKPLNISLQNPDPVKMLFSSQLSQQASNREKLVWETRINVLAALIERDVKQSVEQISRKHNWRLVNEGTPHSSDRTSAFAAELQTEWNTGAERKTP